ncbi:MAG: hypothetical protein CL717_01205 [Chloroflexi bacterium]|nr:hypothetical protein [Chloroflexota bacterium]|tara:strand:+ start:1762 stop:2322 length:561 start_codon:yes stop_codon:yes gene_type:complete
MNYRISFILIVIALIISIYVGFFELRKPPKTDDETIQAPWFYDIGYDELSVLDITSNDSNESFTKINGQWTFSESGDKVDLNRWSGIPLLFTGPRSSRLITNDLTNPEEYGIDAPSAEYIITLRTGISLKILVGTQTPDLSSNYVNLEGKNSLFLVPASWVVAINDMALNPPYYDPNTADEPIIGP